MKCAAKICFYVVCELFQVWLQQIDLKINKKWRNPIYIYIYIYIYITSVYSTSPTGDPRGIFFLWTNGHTRHTTYTSHDIMHACIFHVHTCVVSQPAWIYSTRISTCAHTRTRTRTANGYMFRSLQANLCLDSDSDSDSLFRHRASHPRLQQPSCPEEEWRGCVHVQCG